MFGNDWDKVLDEEIHKNYFINLLNNINKEYKTKIVYPKKQDVFRAFRNSSYKDTKVVILGQDPYHGENEAEGLAFSVSPSVKIPPSLKNIFKELHDDLGYEIPNNGSLVKWTKENVLLLNTILTVEKDKPLSHKSKGWEIFTDEVIRKLNERDKPIVFILWGNYAKSKKELITNKNHFIIESSHPSPYSANYGFFGSKPFSKANAFLEKNNIKPINWNLN